MVDFLIALIELFLVIYYRTGIMRRQCVQSSGFHKWSTSLHSNFTWRGSSPISHSWG